MKKFNYKAKDEAGKLIKGVVEARDKKQAIQLLRARKLLVFSLSEQRESFMPRIKAFRRVKMDDKVNFTRQLATMINAGLPLTESLSILEAQSTPAMSPVIGEVLRQVEAGGNLADALEKHPDVFDKVYVALVRAGEAAGILDKILKRLAENIEKERDFKGKVKGAMIYPAIILIGMTLVIFIMVIFVIPRLTVLYEEFEADLPAVTKVMLAISNAVSKFWWVLVFLLPGFIYLIRILNRNPAFKKQYDELYFRIPIIGNLRRQVMFTEFTRTLGLLVGAGILIVDALNIVKDSLGSPLYAEALNGATKKVEKGFPLATALAQAEIFPPLLPQMVAVGEQTGKLDEVLGKIALYFEQEAEKLVKGLTTALEPLILILLGIGVGFLLIAVIMPIYNLTSQF